MAAEITAFCMKCREKRAIKSPKQITHPNGKVAVTGTCSTCGTKIFRMGKLAGASTKAAPEAASKKSTGTRSKVKVS